MNKIVLLLAAAIVAVIVLFSMPALASDCNGCGPHKSRFE